MKSPLVISFPFCHADRCTVICWFETCLFIGRSWGHFTSAGSGVDRVSLSWVFTAPGPLSESASSPTSSENILTARRFGDGPTTGRNSIVYSHKEGRCGCGHAVRLCQRFTLRIRLQICHCTVCGKTDVTIDLIHTTVFFTETNRTCLSTCVCGYEQRNK